MSVEQNFVSAVLTLKAMHPELYGELVRGLGDLKDHYRDLAFRGEASNNLFLTNGFARGVAEIHRLVRDASILGPQPTAGR